MPLASGQKGTGKKNAGSIARQRSRNTTPSSVPPTASLPPIEAVETEYLDLKFELFRNITYEDIIDSNAPNAIPDSKSLDGTLTRLQRLQETIEQRGTYYDRGMRLLAQNRKTRMDEMAAERGREEERLRREADDEERERRANKKKRKAPDHPAAPSSKADRSSPARDSSGKSSSGKWRKSAREHESASSSLSPAGSPNAMDVDRKAKEQENSDSDSSSDDGRPPPRPVPQNQTFGEDPSTFPDPTVYEIKPVEAGMTEDEIRAIYSVAVYPRSDLADLIAGDPPDKDFSSAKPSNQISFSTFSTYIEPYFRPFTEEDLGFLRERGDRVQPFVMPKRGDKHYLDKWAEEDGHMAIDTSPAGDKLPPNQPRGSIENMDDELAETDKLSVGPLLTRLLQAMRPESRATPSEDRPATNGVHNDSLNGDISMTGTDPFTDTPAATNGTTVNGTDEKALPPATLMAESATDAWKKASHPKLDYSQVDERIKQELRHIGFLPGALANGGAESGTANGTSNGNNTSASGEPTADYDGHYDDEIAARLRLLQARLREQVLLNGARKARLAELVKERMAHQEYQTILEDLDTQVQAAYLKRTRTMGKSKKGKRPGAAAAGGAAAGGAAGMARPGIGDLTKTLMERRRRWIENIGTVFDEDGAPGKVPRASDPDSSIFKPAEMAGLVKKEKEAWDEEVEDVE